MEFFGMDSKDCDPDNIQFVYVTFSPYRAFPSAEKGTWNPNFLGTFSWGAKGIGFGEVAMYRMSDKEPGCNQIYFDTEHMSKNFLKQMFAYFVEQSITDRDNPDSESPEYDCEYKPIGE